MATKHFLPQFSADSSTAYMWKRPETHCAVCRVRSVTLDGGVAVEVEMEELQTTGIRDPEDGRRRPWRRFAAPPGTLLLVKETWAFKPVASYPTAFKERVSYVLAEASGKLIEVDADEGCRGAWNGRRHLRFWNDIDDSRTILRGEHQLQTAQL